jgi:hypothetical protein
MPSLTLLSLSFENSVEEDKIEKPAVAVAVVLMKSLRVDIDLLFFMLFKTLLVA